MTEVSTESGPREEKKVGCPEVGSRRKVRHGPTDWQQTEHAKLQGRRVKVRTPKVKMAFVKVTEKQFMKTRQLVGVWRIHKPDTKRYTWQRINPLQ